MTVSANDLLRWARVPGFRDVYVVGCLDDRVSIRSQQMRALNLVWALREAGRLQSGAPLVVVGGGIAGCTAAAAAASLDEDVLLLEAETDVFTAQAGCTERTVHPNILDWPEEGSSRDDAGLPIMNWQAGTAADVIATLRTKWKQIRATSSIQVVTGARVTDADLAFSEGTLRYRSAEEHRNVAYGAVLLAVGFGSEKDLATLAERYWRQDSFEQHQEQQSFVVSGLGDGALCDALRLRLGGADPSDRFFGWLQRLLVVEQMRRLAPHVADLERSLDGLRDRASARKTADGKKAAEEFSEKAFQRYRGIWNRTDELADAASSLQRDILARCRKDTDVRLIGRLPLPFDPRASPLHRFLLSALIDGDGRTTPSDVRFEYVRATTNAAAKSYTRLSDDYVEVASGAHWVLRHGTNSAVQQHMPKIAAMLKGSPQRAGFEWPRQQQFPDLYFSKKTGT